MKNTYGLVLFSRPGYQAPTTLSRSKLIPLLIKLKLDASRQGLAFVFLCAGKHYELYIRGCARVCMCVCVSVHEEMISCSSMLFLPVPITIGASASLNTLV